MTNITTKDTKKQRLQHIVDLLKFVVTLDDDEILIASVESIIELLEEEISNQN